MRIDLHAHSTASDGTDSPRELVAQAARAGVRVLAVTDHDTTAGWAEALDAADTAGIRLVPGAELSTATTDARGRHVTAHVLAYLFDPAHPALVAEQQRLRDERLARLRRITRRMTAAGFPVTEDGVLASVPPGASAGRPHLARALVAAGVVGSVSEAFDRFLRDGGPYHLRRADTPVLDAVRLIAAAGGVTVLAHPQASRRGPVVDDDVIAELAAAGLTGVEVDHPEHDQQARSRLRFLAAELDLVATGGSDYHGSNKPTPIAAETTDPAAFERVLDAAAHAARRVGRAAAVPD